MIKYYRLVLNYQLLNLVTTELVPIVTTSIEPYLLISPTSTTNESILAVPSRCKSLNPVLLEPKSTSLSVVGKIEPLLNVTCVYHC